MSNHSKTLLFGYINAPKLPQYLEELAFTQWQSHQGDYFAKSIGQSNGYLHRKVKKDGKIQVGNTWKTVVLGNELLIWAKNNLSHKVNDILLSCNDPGNNYLGSHVDMTRDFAIIYPVKTGGPYATTCIYFDKTFNGLTPPNLSFANNYQEDYDKLVTVSQLQIPQRTWVLMNVKAMHGVENISEGRIIIHASIDDISDLDITHASYYEYNPPIGVDFS